MPGKGWRFLRVEQGRPCAACDRVASAQPHTRVKCHAQSDSMRLPGAWCESARHCEPKSFVTAVASRGLVAMRVLWRGPGLCGGAHGLHAGARGGRDINHVPAAAPAHRRTRAPHFPIAFVGLPRPVLSTTMRHAVPAPHAGWLCACRERRAVPRSIADLPFAACYSLPAMAWG